MEMHTLRFPLPPGDFDPGQTLDCGQCFRFAPSAARPGFYEGVAGDKPCRIGRQGDALVVECGCADGGCAAFWQNYLDLGRDYAALKAYFSQDGVLCGAIGYCPGLRLLRQDTWEALCSFIISQNNNIPRIKGIIGRLCAAFGREVGEGLHAFPPPGALAPLTQEDLAPLRAGFRARYLLDAARRVTCGALDLAALATRPLGEARRALQTVQGVGPKVAECVLLYGCGRTDCFPEDVWIKRALGILYPEGFPAAFAPVAGIAQQYLFHYCRTCPGALEAGCPA